MGYGSLLRLDEPAESVFLGDPAIADLRVVAPDLVYIFGKKTGTTNLIAISADMRPPAPGPGGYPAPPQRPAQASLIVRVTADTTLANDAIHQLNPKSALQIKRVNQTLFVTGTAKNIDEAAAAAEIAKKNSPPGNPPVSTAEIQGSQQVNIRVRFAEISRADRQTLGIDWGNST